MRFFKPAEVREQKAEVVLDQRQDAFVSGLLKLDAGSRVLHQRAVDVVLTTFC